MRQRVLMQLTEFAPDQRDRDSQSMKEATNVLPLHGQYRSASELAERVQVRTPWPITGSYSHLLTAFEATLQFVPKSDESTVPHPEWKTFGSDELPEEDREKYYPHVGSDPASDKTGIQERVGGLASIFWFGLGTVLDPGRDDGFVMRIRVEIINHALLATYTLAFGLWQGKSTQIHRELIDLATFPETGINTYEFDIPSASIATITDWSDLQLEVTSDKTLTDPDELSNVLLIELVSFSPFEGWTRSDDDFERDGHEYLGEDETEYLTSPVQDGEASLKGKLPAVLPPYDPATETIRLRAVVEALEGDQEVFLRLHEGDTLIREFTFTATVAEGQKTITGDLEQADVDKITDGKEMQLEVGTEGSGATGSDAFKRPTDAWGNVGWFDQDGSDDRILIANAINEDVLDESTFIYTANDAEADLRLAFFLSASAGFPGTSDVEVVLEVEAAEGAGNLTVAIEESGTYYASQVFYVSERQQLVMKIEASVAQTVPWATANLRFNRGNNSGAWQPVIYQAYAKSVTGAPVNMNFRSLYLQRSNKSVAGTNIFHMEMLVPGAESTLPGDQGMIYVGTERNLVEAREAGFVGVSKLQDGYYGQPGNGPGERQMSWDFCSWGDRVIATNAFDPVQWQTELGARFEDLITSEDKPTARFCAVVRDFLFLANLRLENDTSGSFNDLAVWWSAINDPQTFKKLDLATQSDYQQLVATPGEITGLVGGEFATIFKRNSIYRARYVGPPVLFDFEVISYAEGTAYPRSIVQVDRDIFFFGSGGFRHLPYGGGLRPLGDGKITKMFTDNLYEECALAQFSYSDAREIDAALVGKFDSWSGLIYWLYRGKEDSAYRNNTALVYNPLEDRWSLLKDFDSYGGISEISTKRNLPTSQGSVSRGIVMFSWDGLIVRRMEMPGTRTLPAKYASAVMSSAALGAEIGRAITIYGVRPVVQTGTTPRAVDEKELDISFRIQAGADQHLLCDRTVTEITFAPDNESADGWYMLDNPVTAEFFVFESSVPQLFDEILTEYLGIELDVELPGGKR